MSVTRQERHLEDINRQLKFKVLLQWPRSLFWDIFFNYHGCGKSACVCSWRLRLALWEPLKDPGNPMPWSKAIHSPSVFSQTLWNVNPLYRCMLLLWLLFFYASTRKYLWQGLCFDRYHHFVPPEAATPGNTGGENTYMLGWGLWTVYTQPTGNSLESMSSSFSNLTPWFEGNGWPKFAVAVYFSH